MNNTTNVPSGAKPRMSIHDVELEDSPHMYVYNNGPALQKTIAHMLISHTSKQTGNAGSFELPMTRLPIDLADFAPKEELMANPDIRKMWSKGYLDFVPAKEAREILARPDSQDEIDRLRKAREPQKRIHEQQNDQSQEQLLADARERQALPPAQVGRVDDSTADVSSAVLSVMEENLSQGERAATLQNLRPIMTEADLRFVRSRTEDPELRKIVA